MENGDCIFFFLHLSRSNFVLILMGMVLDFRALSMADREKVLSYTLRSARQNCDLCFVNLFAWQFLYQTEMAEYGGFLFFRFYADGHPAYMLPLGEGDLMAAVSLLKEDACRRGYPLLLLGVGRDYLPQLERFEQAGYVTNENRNYADYLYLREALTTLSGKKLQPKRNHANKFRRLYPNYEYRPLTSDLVPLCLALDEEWITDKTVPGEQRAVRSEAEAIRRALTHLEELELVGGTLFVDNYLVAFTYGAPINHNTFDVCVEKADRRYEGAYAVINQEFARHLPECFVYVNREEDLGIEGLRKAKLSYQPHRLLEKLSLWSACTLPLYRETNEVQRRELHIKWQVRALWKLCFGDTDAFMRLYFSDKYKPEYNSFLEKDGLVVAALQRLPYRMNFCGGVVPVGYISGACTRPENRGRGLMAALLAMAHRQMLADGQLFSVLIPAGVSLSGYYRRFGYADCPVPVATCVAEMVTREEEQGRRVDVFRARTVPEAEAAWHACLEKTLRQRPGAVLHTPADFSVVLDDVFLSGGAVCVQTEDTGERVTALLLAVPDGDGLRILESSGAATASEALLTGAALRALGMPADAPVQRQTNAVQVRVLDAAKALTLFAAAHPDFTAVVRIVGDEALMQNNGFYCLQSGRCDRLVSPDCCTESLRADRILSIGQLPGLLFDGEAWPRLSLMLN